MSVDTATRTSGAVPDNILSADKRWYVFGEGDQQERLMRVSTALDLVGDNDGLMRWATGLAADAAYAELPRLIRSLRLKECGKTWNRCKHDFRIRCVDCACGDCQPCLRKWAANRHYGESSRRAEEGTLVHDVQEEWIKFDGRVKGHDEAIAVYVQQWLKWVQDYGLTPDSWDMCEATVINRTHRYAGTLDGIVRVNADATPLAADLVAMILGLPLSQVIGRSVRVIADTKSREKEEAKLFSDMSLQQSGYRHAEVVRLRDGRELPMPATDGAIIVQVRPDGYLCRPVASDAETFQRGFLNALGYAYWDIECGTASVSSRSFKVPKEPKPVKAVKAAKTAAAPVGEAAAERPPVRKAATKRAPAKKATAAAAPKVGATMQSLIDWPKSNPAPAQREPHPASPQNDFIPF